MRRNPFLVYLERHEDADLTALKEPFRSLAKRTHPDLGAADSEQFVRLQDDYHEAITVLIERSERPTPYSPDAERPSGGPGCDAASRVPRDETLVGLYRYKAHRRSLALWRGQAPRRVG